MEQHRAVFMANWEALETNGAPREAVNALFDGDGAIEMMRRRRLVTREQSTDIWFKE